MSLEKEYLGESFNYEEVTIKEKYLQEILKQNITIS